MSNMSYCRFRNTLTDFKDCLDTLEAMSHGDEGKLSEAEEKAARELAEYAYLMIELVGDLAGTCIDDLDDRDFELAIRHAQNSASSEDDELGRGQSDTFVLPETKR